MNYTASQLSTILFSSQSGSQMVTQLNYALKKLIDNDISLARTDSSSPKTWECRWMNDSSVPGYSRGEAVWLNVASPRKIVKQNYQKILQYVNDNIVLRQLFSDVNQDDIEAVMQFLDDVVVGRASDEVPPLYFIRDNTQQVQIRISTKDGNKDMPNADSWKDFYDTDNTYDSNLSLLLSSTSADVSQQLDEHVKDFHMPQMQPSQMSTWLQAQSFFKRDGFDPDTVKTQKFFDHDYCQLMTGFDYAVSFKRTGQSWCRVWRSGYVEQGGFIDNNGQSLIEVILPEKYNYPNGMMFYQRGWHRLAGSDAEVSSKLSVSRRYIAVVTPVKKDDAEHAYPPAKSYDGEIVYASVDIANMSNSSFSFVNVDTDVQTYSKYSWHACGYRT